MSDVENAYKQIASFLNNETEKTLLICGIADEEKHRTLLKALNVRGRSKGLIFLIHTTKDGMEDFFRWAGLSKVKVPKKYGQSMQLSNLTIYFDNLSTRSSSNKYDNYAFDFMIVWPMQSVTKNPEEIQEPWYSPEPLKPYVDRIVTLDCENDNPKEYQRIMAAYKEDQIHQEQRNRFY